jgi:hypothetical protein
MAFTDLKSVLNDWLKKRKWKKFLSDNKGEQKKKIKTLPQRKNPANES